MPRSAGAKDLTPATLRPICRRRFWDAAGLGASTDNDPATPEPGARARASQ
jgi:hypothetical protein